MFKIQAVYKQLLKKPTNVYVFPPFTKQFRRKTLFSVKILIFVLIMEASKSDT